VVIPGAADLGAVAYVEGLCTALDGPMPRIFAGGPFSGRRAPPGTNNDFENFLPLDRASLHAWRVYLYGSADIVGLRDHVKAILADARSAGEPPAVAFTGLRIQDRDLLIDLVTEAVFAAPEYGGNAGLGGWKLARYEGDTQPVGYSIFRDGRYTELPDAPVAGPNASDPAPMDDETRAFVRAVVGLLGGEEVV
jgi:hypothetical protein